MTPGQLTGVMQDYARMRAEGVSREDACRGLETILREIFPRSKFPPRCTRCDDLGRAERTCWAEQRCGREWCAKAHPSHEHGYLVPCECAAGDRFRRQPARPSAAIAAAAQVAPRPRHAWTRPGA